MKNSRQEFFLSWMEGVARHITDPVARLRFLKAAAPSASSVDRAATFARREGTPVLISFVLALLLIVAFAVVYPKFTSPSKDAAKSHSTGAVTPSPR